MSSNPEAVAADLVRASGKATPPLDFRRIIELLPGVRVTLEALDHDGFIVDVPGGAEILVNKRTSSVRQRFTLAHELGHHVLRIGLGQLAGAESHSETERWCDGFAVGLLMPMPWVADFIGSAPLTQQAARVSRGPRAFQVSRMAFWLRAAEVTKAWIFELNVSKDAASVSRDVQPPPPADVVSIATACALRLGPRTSASLTTYHWNASCTRMPTRLGDIDRSLAVVTPR